MKKFAKLFLAAIIAIIGVSSLISLPTFADNTTFCSSEDIPEDVRAAAGCGEAVDPLSPTIVTILNSIIAVAGTISVIFVVIGGINYMTSTGDPGKVEKAKKTIFYACIGIAVCALAFAITNFVINIVNNVVSTAYINVNP